MKIAHLSDLHLNTFFKDSNLDKITQLLKYAIDEGFDHMVITGDLTDNADPEDFKILRNLFRSLGLLNSKKLSIVIGNHDLFGGLQTAEDILIFPERCRTTDYISKVREFENYFPELFTNCIYRGKESVFPYAKIIGDVLMVGVNSIAKYSKIKNPFASNGEIELSQFYEIDDILSNYGPYAKTKLILVHHHFNKITTNSNTGSSLWQNVEKQTMKLRKKKRLFKLFNIHKIDLIMHGHIHENIEYERKGLKFLNAGACIKGCPEKNSNINFIDIQPDKMNIVIHNVHLSEEKKVVIKSKDVIVNQETYPVLPAHQLFN